MMQSIDVCDSLVFDHAFHAGYYLERSCQDFLQVLFIEVEYVLTCISNLNLLVCVCVIERQRQC